MRGESGISLTGLYICGVDFLRHAGPENLVSLIPGRGGECILPLGLFVGFNVTNIVVAFIYLSFAHIPERPEGDEAHKR